MNWRKVGRNEICPCGSGKKYKKCCGQEDPDAIDRGEVLRETVMEVVDNQLRDLNPPETIETFNRLLAEGYNEDEARHFIGSAVTFEMLIVM